MPITLNKTSLHIGNNGLDNSTAISRNFQRISSGKRIHQSSDDTAGLAISESLTALTKSLGTTDRNTTNAISITSVKDGGLQQMGDITTRLRELAVQSADEAVNSTDREFLNTEFQALQQEADRLSKSSEFNGQKLLSGAVTNVTIQVGTAAADTVNVKVGGVDSGTLGLSGLSISGTDGSNATNAISKIDDALKTINQERADNEATKNRLVDSLQSTSTRRTRLEESNTSIRDANFAEETSQVSRNQVLQNARSAVSAQANHAASLVLNLLN